MLRKRTHELFYVIKLGNRKLVLIRLLLATYENEHFDKLSHCFVFRQREGIVLVANLHNRYSCWILLCPESEVVRKRLQSQPSVPAEVTQILPEKFRDSSAIQQAFSNEMPLPRLAIKLLTMHETASCLRKCWGESFFLSVSSNSSVGELSCLHLFRSLLDFRIVWVSCNTFVRVSSGEFDGEFTHREWSTPAGRNQRFRTSASI